MQALEYGNPYAKYNITQSYVSVSPIQPQLPHSQTDFSFRSRAST